MNSMKKVLIFSDCYIYGGSEKLMTFLLKNEILNNDFNIFFAYRKYKEYEIGLKNDALLDRKSNYPLSLLSNETLFHKINCLVIVKPLKILLKLPFLFLQKIQFYSIWNLFVFIILLRKVKPEIIHVNNGGYPGAKSCNILVLANYVALNSKIIYQVNNQAQKNTSFFSYHFDMFIQKNVSYFINASLKAKQQLIDGRRFEAEKILVTNNCVPLVKLKRNRTEICRDLKIPVNSFLITQVGFLTERKGQKYLIEAFKNLLKKNVVSQDKSYLIVIGNGEDESLLRTYISEIGMEDNVFLLGYRNDSEDFIAASDLFVLPSIRDEDMPLVLLTALGYGKPIIATDFAGISQVIESGKNGILINNDIKTLVSELANGIEEIYNSGALKKLFSDNAKLSYTDYTPEKYGLKLKDIYNSLT